MGSMLAAVASYLAARSAGVAWHVRLDDLDEPRNETGADARILQTLEAHGLIADAPPERQSARTERYASALRALEAQGHTYYCTCSRRSLPKGQPYPGTCRGNTAPRDNAAVRLRAPDRHIAFDDAVQGHRACNLSVSGDIVLRRRDGIYAYHLACAVDDGRAHITQVVRGADLLDQTPAQIALMQLLGLSQPSYAHIPVLHGSDGSKLSKQTGAQAVNDAEALTTLRAVISLLGMPPAPGNATTPTELLAACLAHFELGEVPTSITSSLASNFDDC